MSKGKIRYKTTIAGRPYTIIGARPEEHMRSVSKMVNEQMQQIESLSKGLDSERRAVLVAVNAVSDQINMQIELNTLQKQIVELEKKLEKAQELKISEE
ncbi:cell division protein ZapA [Carnobacterium alterfunditum]|uniref:Cell division protein ZapA n=1 Tax=Carnobacterium alterfunditum TaxID=28230 RepID=A0A1N6G3F1_9LACT|nr:cell division protein ZapA [Carnobacterium alterfunditum]SIO02030.1 cell division protein ZapA [Carnobacterium alterfunditum]